MGQIVGLQSEEIKQIATEYAEKVKNSVIKLHWTSRKQSLYFYTKNNDLRLEYNFVICVKTIFFYKLHTVFQPSTFMCDWAGGALCGGSAGKIWTRAATQASAGITQQTNHSKNKRARRGDTHSHTYLILQLWEYWYHSHCFFSVYIFIVSWFIQLQSKQQEARTACEDAKIKLTEVRQLGTDIYWQITGWLGPLLFVFFRPQHRLKSWR